MRERNQRRDRFGCLMVLAVAGCLLTGCSSGKTERITITQPTYEKKVYETAEVCRGALTPTVSLTLRMRKLKYMHYSVTDGGLEVDRIVVSVGDRVKKGDLLVSFSSEELQAELKEYQEKKKQNALLIRHYKNLQRADRSQDHREEIRELEQEQKVTGLYIQETERRIRKNQIYARRDGTITGVSSKLKEGTVLAGSELVTQAYGSGIYMAEAEENENFSVGTTVQSVVGSRTYRFRLTKKEKDRSTHKKRLYFKPLSDMSAVPADTALVVKWKKAPLEDCVYVDKRAIHNHDGRDFVYRADENGYYEAVEIKTGHTVGDYIVIVSGLSVGEKVRIG